MRAVEAALSRLAAGLRSLDPGPAYTGYYRAVEDCEDWVDRLEEEEVLPTRQEWGQAAGLGILQVQTAYNLTAAALSRGEVAGAGPSSPHRLDTADCVFLADTADRLGKLAHRVQWLQVICRYFW